MTDHVPFGIPSNPMRGAVKTSEAESKAIAYGWVHHPEGPWQARWRRYSEKSQYEHQVSTAEMACELSERATPKSNETETKIEIVAKAIAKVNGHYPDGIQNGEPVWLLYSMDAQAALKALATPAPEPQPKVAAEPVAWRGDGADETRKFTAIQRVAEIWAEQGLSVTPLYASPPPVVDEAVKADVGDEAAIEIADAVIAWMVKYDLLDEDLEYHDDDIIAVLNDLLPAPPARSATP